jgi:hypothetical protein
VTRHLIVTAISLILLVGLAVPAAAADRDGDGLRDGWEKRFGITSHKKKDSDGDGVIDSAEDRDGDKLSNLGEQRWRTNPKRKDTDRDGKPDGREDRNKNGISNRLEQDKRPLPRGLAPTLAAAKLDVPNARAECMSNVRSAKVKRCWFGPKRGKRTVAIMGDSHAVMWLPSAIKSARVKDWRLVSLLKGGCVPLLGIINTREYDVDGGKTCRTWRKDAYAWLRRNKIDLLVIAFADSYQLRDKDGRTITGNEKVKRWRAGAKKTYAATRDPGKVVILGDIPRNVGNPITCLQQFPSNMSKCQSKKEPLKQRKIERAFRQAAEVKGGQFRTLYSQICSYDPCPLVHGNVLLWRDRHHVTATFANRLWPSLRKLMAEGIAAGRK